MAEGWVLVAGVATLFGLIGFAAVILSGRRGSLEARHGLLGFGLIAAGVIVALAVGSGVKAAG
jgi:hypothetical protein